MPTYQPAVIQRSADRLYARAAVTTATSTVLGVLIGTVVAPYLLQALPSVVVLHCPEWVCSLVLGVVGLGQGLERATQLRLQAQTALCQLQIEANTRCLQGEGPTPTE